MRIAERHCNVPSTDESRCRQSMTPHPLNDAEFDSLGDVLKRFGSKQAMNVEQLDGFLAALICDPSDIPKTEIERQLQGGHKKSPDGKPGPRSLRTRCADATGETATPVEEAKWL